MKPSLVREADRTAKDRPPKPGMHFFWSGLDKTRDRARARIREMLLLARQIPAAPESHHGRGPVMASAPRVAHPVVRRSMNSITRYMLMPMMLVTRSPAKASGTSKREEATSIRLPMPLFAATVSATIEPTNASVMATFSAAKKYGIDRGRPIF